MTPHFSLLASDTSPNLLTDELFARLSPSVRSRRLKAQKGGPAVDIGKFQYNNGFFRYVGATTAGVPDGYGVLYLGDGGVLEGDFSQGELTCQLGCRRWSDGSSYTGPLRDGEAHGHGRYISASGETYEGEFVAGLRHGEGLLRDTLQKFEYRGGFENHHFCGKGKYISPLVTFDGEFRDGVPHGRITADYRNGDTFIGETQLGAASGHGSFFSSSQQMQYTGLFVAGERANIPTTFGMKDILINGSATLNGSGNVDAPAPTQHLNLSASGAMEYSGASFLFDDDTTDFLSLSDILPAAVRAAPGSMAEFSEHQTIKNASHTKSLSALSGAIAASFRKHKKTLGSASEPRFIDQLSFGDGFFTVPLGVCFEVSVGVFLDSKKLMPETTGVRKVLSAKSAKEPPPMILAVDNRRLVTEESGRRVTMTVYKFPEGANAIKAHVGKLLGANQSARETAQVDQQQALAEHVFDELLRDRAKVAIATTHLLTPTDVTAVSKYYTQIEKYQAAQVAAAAAAAAAAEQAARAASRQNTPSDSKRPGAKKAPAAKPGGKQKLPPLKAKSDNSPLSLESDLPQPPKSKPAAPHGFDHTKATENGAATFLVQLLTNEPGDFVVKFDYDRTQGVQLAPGPEAELKRFDPSSIRAVYLPLHVVRQC